MHRKIQTALLLVIAGLLGILTGAVAEIPLLAVIGIACMCLAVIALIAGAVQSRH